MNIVLILAPLSVLLALAGLGAFWWTLKSGQYDDPMGDAARILAGDPEDRPL
jgi:cbb3-type cytochrome oxidase maturation protein